MYRRITAALFTAATLLAPQAHAWTAFAAGDNNYTHIAFNADDPDTAQADALNGCANETTNCRLQGNPVRATTFILARGTDGWAFVSGVDPKKTADEAMRDCRKTTTHCRILNAVWDEGRTYTVIAASKSYTQISYGNNSLKAAKDDALANCAKHTPTSETCEIVSDGITADNVFFARAENMPAQGSNANTSASGIGRAPTLDKAKAMALASCKDMGGEACKVTWNYENPGPHQAPGSFEALRRLADANRSAPAKTQVAANRNAEVVRCSNSCVNGDCIRTFPDGRKERWHAPRVFDPFQNDWKWDTATHACGV